ncbi:ground-like domain protein, partial [Cooperia oncophora]
YSGFVLQCGRKKRQASRVAEPVRSYDRRCNNEQLREIILNGIRENPDKAISLIHSEARAKLGGSWAVVCASEPMSFITQSQQYCLDGHGVTWCNAFLVD